MNNAVFGKTTENVRKHGDVKLATTEERRNPKPVYLGLSILEISKIVMYEFWHD